MASVSEEGTLEDKESNGSVDGHPVKNNSSTDGHSDQTQAQKTNILLVSDVHRSVFFSSNIKEEFESAFRAHDPSVKFMYARPLNSARLTFTSPEVAYKAMEDLSGTVLCYGTIRIIDVGEFKGNETRRRRRLMDARHSSRFTWHGVKPTCVQERWFSCEFGPQEFREDKTTLNITEMFQGRPSANKEYQIALPECIPGDDYDYDTRPQCVACHNDLLILQYNTRNRPCSRFFLVDLKRQTIQMFEDSEQYFNREFFKTSSIECLIIPGLHHVLFRLPQRLITSNRWSYLSCAKFSQADDGSTIIGDITFSSRKAHRNQALAFHAKYTDCLATVSVDVQTCCIKLSIENLASNETLIESTCRLGANFSLPQLNPSETSGESNRSNASSLILQNCHADFSRGGELLLFYCALYDDTKKQQNVEILMFDAETLNAVKQVSHPDLSSTFSSDRTQFANFMIFCSCGCRLEVWNLYGLTDQNCDKVVPGFFELPRIRPPSLQEACRVAILQNCPAYEVSTLRLPMPIDRGLPKKLLLYLRFQKDHLLENPCKC